MTPSSRFRFRSPVRVRFIETDPQAVVNHAHFFAYFEAARMEYWQAVGFPLEKLRALGADDSVVSAEATYRAPARFYDRLDVHVRTSRLGRTSYTVEFLATRGEAAEVIAEGRTTHVIVDLQTRRPTPIPDPFRAALQAFEGSTLEGGAGGQGPGAGA